MSMGFHFIDKDVAHSLRIMFKYLGVSLDNNLNWKFHFENTVLKKLTVIGVFSCLMPSHPFPVLVSFFNIALPPRF